VGWTPSLRTYHALLVRTFPWSERDRLAVLFEPTLGVLRARAISALETGSKLAPQLIAPALGRFTLARGRSPIPVLANVELTDRFSGWRANGLAIRVAGVVLAALAGLDAPEDTNRRFFVLSKGFLRTDPADNPLPRLALFLVKALGYLGLLGGETECSLCGVSFSKGKIAAAPDLKTFICNDCYNELYGKAEVSVVFVDREHLELLKGMADIPLSDFRGSQISDDALSFVFSLACARLEDILPNAVSALLPITAAPYENEGDGRSTSAINV
jgi:DNA repair protein RecO